MPILIRLFHRTVVLVLLTGVTFLGTTPVTLAATEGDVAAVPGSGEDSEESTEKVSDKEGEGSEEIVEARKAGPEEQLTLWDVMKLGGKLMYLLALLSFATIVLITFYFLSLSPSNAVPPLFAQKVRDMISKGRAAEAKMFCEQHDNVLSRILRKGLASTEKDSQVILEAMRSEGERQASGLWQRISYLADIAVVAPMVGLLGTVVGMMHTFMDMRRSLTIGGVRPDTLAGGIFEAMVTTVAGLIIAIIATGFYAYFRGVVQRIIISLEEITSRYGELLEGGKKE